LSYQLLDLSPLVAPRAAREQEELVSLPPLAFSASDWAFCGLILVAFVLLAYSTLHGALFQPLWLAAEQHRWGHLVVRPSILLLIMGSAMLGFRTVLWMRYRPFPSASLSAAPSLTVVIPAYNEGPMVVQSIESAANAFYPRERLEIFVVDDGSTDDTWRHIRKAASRYPGLVHPIRLPQNQGKRAALEVGFRRARGEVIVTMDSDSVIDPDALLALAGPFRDPKVGAVAGKVTVYNRKGIIPRMLHVQYILSFDLMRAVESSYGTVYCCPGALTAYRAPVVHQVLDAWMRQTFLGARCTYGEDRALTNMILESGYNTVYQRTAHVHTVVPARYKQLCRMFLRWDRSYIREEIQFMRVVWKRPLGPRIIALFDRIITNTRLPVSYVSLVLLVSLAADNPLIMFRVLTAIFVIALFNMLYYLRSEPSKDFLFGICYSYFAFFSLFWILPYAALTLRSRSWLTR
jgi:hyaluronan synthase